MFHRLWIAAATALCLGLTACGGTLPAASSSGASSSGSGITVFGDIDASVGRTR